jgi:histidinol phosphatase-like enzyme (inositol monophosphatase family)
MTTSIQSLVESVTELARLAGDRALSLYRRDVTVDTKTDGSPVTDADRGAERLAREWIAQRFPGDGILGEEFGLERPDSKRRWIIDPIDGTKAFIRGVPLWGTLVAVAEGPHVVAGAAFFPAVDEIVIAGVGEGCWWNGSRCRVSGVDRLDRATILTTDDRFQTNPNRREAWLDLAMRSAVCRTWGDCYGYLLVATGRAEAMIDDVISPWDVAAFAPIISEAGGALTDWRGVETPFGAGAVATNTALSHDIRGFLDVPVA